MKTSFHTRRIAAIWLGYALRTGTFAALALLAATSGRCSDGSPDPLLAAGEQAIVGSYKLGNVLLAPGQVVRLPIGNWLLDGFGDTPEQATAKGLLNVGQVAVLQRQDCTMTILADHSFVITNLPSADLSHSISATGTWSMQVYHVFDTYGYRIALKCGGSKGPALHAKFFNADKPDPPILEILYGDGKKDSIMFRFANMSRQRG